jgi:hypothetical protein
MAMATPKPNAIVEEDVIDWGGGVTSPWIARSVYGLGGVTWVAQDLGNPALTARTRDAGWAHVWDAVFGWNHDTQTGVLDSVDANGKGYPLASRGVDVGAAVLRGMEHPGRGAALVLLAVVFFVVYWIVAGPGSYFALISWNKKQLSWIAFATAAVVAALLTLAVVRLVLRGPPVVKHTTLVQSAPFEPAVVTARVGLYIPNDGSIPVSVDNAKPGSGSYVAAYAEHPQRHDDKGAPPPVQGTYAVPVPDESGVTAPVPFPYRSTLKKVQARWVGDLPGRLDGKATLSSNPYRGVEGVLTNSTGQDLKDVYVAFRNKDGQVRVIYRERWDRGTTFNFARDVPVPQRGRPTYVTPPEPNETERKESGIPHDGRQGRGPIADVIGSGRADGGWTAFWFPPFRGSGINALVNYEDASEGYIRSLPVMSLFDLIPPARKRADNDFSRFEILRRGVRGANLSHVVENGQMLVLAVSADRQPLPFPLLVDGDPYGGDGDVLHQYVVPLDRTPPVDAPITTTAPSTAPTK